jgi:putative drug exporter of the RND superfamily
VSETATPVSRPKTVRVARWSAEHPWRAIALWLVFVAGCIALGQAAGLRTVTDLDTGVGQSGRAAQIMHDANVAEPATEDVLITSRTGPLDPAGARAAAAAVTTAMRSLTDVSAVAPPVLSKDGTALLVDVTMAGDAESAQDRVVTLLNTTASVQRDFPALRIEEVGGASIQRGVNDQVGSDLSAAAIYSLPVTLVILLIAFGAIIAAGVPVLLALSAVGSATGLAAIVSHILPDSGTTSSMILLMGMAVGVDYSLFYVKRAREERARGRTHLDSIELAAETSGHSILVSGVAVIVAMLGLFVARDAVFSSLAAGSIIVVAVAVLGSLTVLPAVLAKLGRHIDRPRVPVLWRVSAQRADREPRLWSAALRPSLRYPGRTLAVAVLVLLALAIPALTLRLHSDSPKSLPRVIPVIQSYDRLAVAFPGEQSTQQIVVKAPAEQAVEVSAALRALTERLQGSPLLQVEDGPVRTSADNSVHVLRVDTPFDAESKQARLALTQLRSDFVPDAVGAIPDGQWAVGGDTAQAVDYDRHLSSVMPWVIAFVVVMTMLMMGLVFRSLVLALVTAVVNLLSAGAAFGVLALVFQHTWAEGLLDFRSTGAVITWIPLFTFAVLFGLSMDYHVFMISRIREAAATGLSTRDAVRQGILRSAGTVTSAAIVMVSVFSIFASLHMVEMKELGLSLAAAVLIDAVLVRAVVLPSLLVVLGKRRWSPAAPTSAPGGSTAVGAVAGAAAGRQHRSLAPSGLRLRNPVSLLISRAPWASAAYLFSYLLLGGVWFAITLALVLTSSVLAVFWIGLPLLYVTFAVVQAMAVIERARVRMLGVEFRSCYRSGRGSSVGQTLRNRITDRARWRDVVVLVVLWPWLLVLDLLALVAWLIPVTLMSLPFWYHYVTQDFDDGTSARGIALGYFPNGPHGASHYGWFIGDAGSAVTAGLIGLAAFTLVGNYAVTGAARVHVRCIARWFDPRGVRVPASPVDLSPVRMTWATPDRVVAPVPVRSARP